MLTANATEYYTNRANYDGRSFGYKNQPNLLTFEAGEYSLVVFLFMLISGTSLFPVGNLVRPVQPCVALRYACSRSNPT